MVLSFHGLLYFPDLYMNTHKFNNQKPTFRRAGGFGAKRGRSEGSQERLLPRPHCRLRGSPPGPPGIRKVAWLPLLVDTCLGSPPMACVKERRWRGQAQTETGAVAPAGRLSVNSVSVPR